MQGSDQLSDERMLKEVSDDIERYLGVVPGFLKALAFDVSLLHAFWSLYKRALFLDGATPHETKYMMAYQVVRAYSKCPSCIQVHESMMRRTGIPQETIEQIRGDIEKSHLDQKTKNILVFTYHVAEKTRPDSQLINAYNYLLTEEELTEAVITITICKALQDFIHIMNIAH